MVKLANTQDSGSCVRIGLAGSSPASGIDNLSKFTPFALKCSLYRQTEITYINLSNNPLLEDLHIEETLIDSLDISNNKELMVLSLSNCKNIKYLDYSNNTKLQEFFIEGTGIKSIDLSDCPDMINLACDEDTEVIGVEERIIHRH